MMSGGHGHPLRTQQAIQNFPQSYHAEFAYTAVTVVDADRFKSGCQDAELLDYLGAWEGFVVAADLVVFQELDCQDGGAGDGVEGELCFGVRWSVFDVQSIGKYRGHSESYSPVQLGDKGC
jgi:hypothetical protein